MFENIQFFAELYGFKPDEAKQKTLAALDFVELTAHQKKRPPELSGGLLRRLNIACGIVHEPELIFMDEPTVAIDPQSRNTILENIRELNRRGATIIYTSHYMEEVELLCDRVAIVDEGRIIAEGTQDELKRRSPLAYLTGSGRSNGCAASSTRSRTLTSRSRKTPRSRRSLTCSTTNGFASPPSPSTDRR